MHALSHRLTIHLVHAMINCFIICFVFITLEMSLRHVSFLKSKAPGWCKSSDPEEQVTAAQIAPGINL